MFNWILNYIGLKKLDKVDYINEMIYLLLEAEVLLREHKPIRYIAEYFQFE